MTPELTRPGEKIAPRPKEFEAIRETLEVLLPGRAIGDVVVDAFIGSLRSRGCVIVPLSARRTDRQGGSG